MTPCLLPPLFICLIPLTMNNDYYYKKPEKPNLGWAVDCGSINGKNPGTFEYRIVDIRTKKIILNHIIQGTTTNNIAEFLALVEALKLTYDHRSIPIYSDSTTALSWVRKKQIKTTFNVDNPNQLNQINQAITFLNSQKYRYPAFWITKAFGENPADYGRK